MKAWDGPGFELTKTSTGYEYIGQWLIMNGIKKRRPLNPKQQIQGASKTSHTLKTSQATTKIYQKKNLSLIRRGCCPPMQSSPMKQQRIWGGGTFVKGVSPCPLPKEKQSVHNAIRLHYVNGPCLLVLDRGMLHSLHAKWFTLEPQWALDNKITRGWALVLWSHKLSSIRGTSPSMTLPHRRCIL